MGPTDWFSEQKVLEGSRNKQTEQNQKGHWLFHNYPACNAERGWEMEEQEKNWLANTGKFHTVSFVRGIRHKKHLYCFDLNWPVREKWLLSCQVRGVAHFALVACSLRVSPFSLSKSLGLCRALNSTFLCFKLPS